MSKGLTLSVKGKKTYQIGDQLGVGAFGRVFRGLNIFTGEMVAIKEISIEKIFSKGSRSKSNKSNGDSSSELDLRLSNLDANIKNELELLQKLYHQNVVRFVEWIEEKEMLYFVMEYVEGGSLRDAVRRFGIFDERLLLVYVSQVLRGLSYLHEQGISHRDVKGANILVTKEGTCKLADFGSCGYAGLNGDETAVNEIAGTPFWMAPEVIRKEFRRKELPASDIWSLGCTIIELITGSPPYGKLSVDAAMYRMVEDPHPPLPDGLSTDLQEFLLACFRRNPRDRPTADALQSHEWVQRLWGPPPDLVAPPSPSDASSTASKDSARDLPTTGPPSPRSSRNRARSQSISSSVSQSITRLNSTLRDRRARKGTGAPTPDASAREAGKESESESESSEGEDAVSAHIRLVLRATVLNVPPLDLSTAAQAKEESLSGRKEAEDRAVRELRAMAASPLPSRRKVSSTDLAGESPAAALEREARGMEEAAMHVADDLRSLRQRNQELRSKLFFLKDLAGRTQAENARMDDETRGILAELFPELSLSPASSPALSPVSSPAQTVRLLSSEVGWVRPGAKCICREDAPPREENLRGGSGNSSGHNSHSNGSNVTASGMHAGAGLGAFEARPEGVKGVVLGFAPDDTRLVEVVLLPGGTVKRFLPHQLERRKNGRREKDRGREKGSEMGKRMSSRSTEVEMGKPVAAEPVASICRSDSSATNTPPRSSGLKKSKVHK